MPILEEARAAQWKEVMSAFLAAFLEVDTIYHQSEREGWAVQEAEARTVLAVPAAKTPGRSVLWWICGSGA